MVRRVVICAIVVLSFFGCKDKNTDPIEPARLVLKDALMAVEEHDIMRYLDAVDIGVPIDTLHIDILHKTVLQHQQMQEAAHGRCVDIDIIDSDVLSDTLCYLYYQLTFADSVQEVSTQKMVRKDGVWKLRLRN